MKTGRFLRQVGFVFVLMVLAKIAAFAKDLLLSLQFGAGGQTDAYFIANAIPGFVFGGVFATIGMVFLPAFKRALLDNESVAATTYRTAAVCYTSLSAGLGVLTFVCAGYIVSMLAPDLPSATKDLAVTMTRIMAFSFVFSGWVGLQNAVLQSHKLFIWPQIVQVLNHSFVILGLALAALLDGSITLLVYAAVIGWIAIAPVVSLRAATFWPKAKVSWIDRKTAFSLVSLSFPVFLSLSLDQVNVLVGTYLGSSFPEGSISHLNYASRLMLLLSSVFALVIAYVLFPYLTESVVAKNLVKTRHFLAQAVIAVLLLSVPLLIISLCMGEEFITFVFQRGAFRSEDAVASGVVLAYFSPVIVLGGVREVLNRLFLALQQAGTLLFFGVMAMVVNIGASVYFSSRIGLKGIALGMTCGALVYVCAQVFIILTRHRDLLHRDLTRWLAAIAVSSLISAIVGVWVDRHVILSNVRLDFLVSATAVVATFGLVIVMLVLVSARLRAIFRMEIDS